MAAKRGAGYRPARFDPQGVQLERHIVSLIDQLGRINHDIWAWNRQREGWRWGERRDDARKLHPNLVPYEELREDEKQYDRNAAETTIKALLALGYRIAPPDGSVPGESPAETERKIEATRTFIAKADLPSLLRMWQDHVPRSWVGATDLYAKLAKRFSSASEHMLAYEVASEGLSIEPSHDRLRHLQALALANVGATRVADDLASRISAEVHDPSVVEDAIALGGRTQKDLAFAAKDPEAREAHLARSLEAYRHAFERTGGYYPAINAASVAFFAGRRAESARFAKRADTIARREAAEARKRGEPDYWALATVAEAQFILGRASAAKRWYAAAATAAGPRYGDIVPMRRQLRLLAKTQSGREPPWLQQVLRIPSVAVFAAPAARRVDKRLAATLEARLRSRDVGFGYGSADPGAEIVFHEAIAAIGGESHVVLRSPRDHCVKTLYGGVGREWLRRFARIVPEAGADSELERRHEAAEVYVASAGGFADDALMEQYTDLLTLGLAKLQSTRLDTELVVLAVDERTPTVRRWRESGHEVEILSPAPRRGRKQR